MKRMRSAGMRMLNMPLMMAACYVMMSSVCWAIDIQISPPSPNTGKPVTLTVTGCVDCFDLVWEFKHLEKAHVVDGGDGYTVTKTFDIAGPYRVMVTGQQFVSGPWGGYTQFVNRTKEFTVAAAPFTVILTSNSKWTVRGTIGQDDGIVCEMGAKASLCEETYAPGQHLHLKVILNGDEDMIGWQVNDQFLSDADLLKMLIPE